MHLLGASAVRTTLQVAATSPERHRGRCRPLTALDFPSAGWSDGRLAAAPPAAQQRCGVWIAVGLAQVCSAGSQRAAEAAPAGAADSGRWHLQHSAGKAPVIQRAAGPDVLPGAPPPLAAAAATAACSTPSCPCCAGGGAVLPLLPWADFQLLLRQRAAGPGLLEQPLVAAVAPACRCSATAIPSPHPGSLHAPLHPPSTAPACRLPQQTSWGRAPAAAS